jgi:hypothetical protein
MSKAPRSFWRSIVLALAAVGLGGCALDAPTAPNAPLLPSEPAPALLGSLFTKKPLQRDAALPQDVSVSAVIGPAGGRLELPAQGFTLVVPRGAVDSKTTFQLTAIAGDLVAYEFEPHGTTFRVPLQATQKLRDTNFQVRLLSSLIAGYFEERSQLLDRNGNVKLDELIQGLTLPLTGEFKWKIDHFSGYIVAY